MLDTILQLVCVDFENIVDLADAAWGERFLVNMNVAIARASVGSVNVKVHYNKWSGIFVQH